MWKRNDLRWVTLSGKRAEWEWRIRLGHALVTLGFFASGLVLILTK